MYRQNTSKFTWYKHGSEFLKDKKSCVLNRQLYNFNTNLYLTYKFISSAIVYCKICLKNSFEVF